MRRRARVSPAVRGRGPYESGRKTLSAGCSSGGGYGPGVVVDAPRAQVGEASRVAGGSGVEPTNTAHCSVVLGFEIDAVHPSPVRVMDGGRLPVEKRWSGPKSVVY